MRFWLHISLFYQNYTKITPKSHPFFMTSRPDSGYPPLIMNEQSQQKSMGKPWNKTSAAVTSKEPPLSVHWAFVVQFRVGTDIEWGPFEGRVEHVVSGQATHFHSLDELLAFMRRQSMSGSLCVWQQERR